MTNFNFPTVGTSSDLSLSESRMYSVNTTFSVQTDKTNQPITSKSISWRVKFRFYMEIQCKRNILQFKNFNEYHSISKTQFKRSTNAQDFDAESGLIKIAKTVWTNIWPFFIHSWIEYQNYLQRITFSNDVKNPACCLGFNLIPSGSLVFSLHVFPLICRTTSYLCQ